MKIEVGKKYVNGGKHICTITRKDAKSEDYLGEYDDGCFSIYNSDGVCQQKNCSYDLVEEYKTYRPFNIHDVFSHLHMTIEHKSTKWGGKIVGGYELNNKILVYIFGNYLSILSTDKLLDEYTFTDGSVCGVAE